MSNINKISESFRSVVHEIKTNDDLVKAFLRGGIPLFSGKTKEREEINKDNLECIGEEIYAISRELNRKHQQQGLPTETLISSDTLKVLDDLLVRLEKEIRE